MKTLPFALLLFITNATFGLGATITVTNTNDTGPGSLRQAIADAAAGDTIVFELPSMSTISLTSAELLVDKNLTISGPGPDELTVEAIQGAPPAPGFRVLDIDAGDIDVTITGISIVGGADEFSPMGLDGGGLLNQSSGAVEIQNCVITGNSALTGGGLSNHGVLNLEESTISNNGATPNFSEIFAFTAGGGIFNAGTLTIVSSTISGNGAFSSESGPPTAFGGGLYNNGTLTIVNCTISGNQMFKGDGGGISNEGGSVTITNSTISANTSDDGTGGVSNSTASNSIALANSIIAGNISSVPDVSGSFVSEGYNLVGDDSGATITPATGDQIGTAAAPIDPKLGPLQNNGGPTETQALLPGSPAIDKGGAADGVNTDQRGRFRPADDPSIAAAEGGDNSDIGAFELQAAQSLNISARLRVLTGENILDGGFIITGTDAKKVIIRGLGPSLANFMLSGFLADPVLELHDTTGLVTTNDNWKDSQEAEIEATGIPPSDDAESAIVATLVPGAYTAILEGKSGGTGIGLVEVYDLDSAANSTLGNISARGFVDTGDNVMIGGFIVGAGEGLPGRVIVRAIGPSLSLSGIVNPLQDPELELHDQNGALIASNDDWKDTQQAEIEATGLAPTNDKEAAIVQTLTDGPYTAIVRGVNDTVGVALVEVFDLH
jgi:hypothetical protein